MPVELRIRDDLSLADVVRLGASHEVKVTPHVGNWTPARLVLPTLGISILCVDHTIGERDRNTHPHLFIRDTGTRVLCDQADRLTTHAVVTRSDVASDHPVGTPLSVVHVNTLRTCYPTADIVTHVEFLHRHREFTLAVLEEVTKISRSAVWWRRVDHEGRVTQHRRKDLPREWREYERSIFPLTNVNAGWLIHNRVAILMDVLTQSQMGSEHEIFHLSGPDMVRYLGGELQMISNMYDRVRTRFALPRETITFNLVPFASFRFAARPSQADACIRLCTELEKETPSKEVLRECLAASADVLAESETERYFSQHDCAATGTRIVVPEVARDWSMATCARNLELVRSLL